VTNSLNVQAEDMSGGLYRDPGWQAVEQVTYHGIKVLVMKKLLKLEIAMPLNQVTNDTSNRSTR